MSRRKDDCDSQRRVRLVNDDPGMKAGQDFSKLDELNERAKRDESSKRDRNKDSE